MRYETEGHFDYKETHHSAISIDYQDLIANGTDTSAITVEWAFHELLRQPMIIKKAQEELDRAIGHERWVQEKDYTQFSYIESIIKETLRLHPVSTMLPPRTALEDCHVAGYDIPKGTILMVNTWSIGRNLQHWESPGESFQRGLK